MSRLYRVNLKTETELDKEILSNHSPDNYLKVILQDYYLYNSQARRDIADILFEKLLELRKHPDTSKELQKNIFLEIYSKLIQVAEDLGLVGLMLLHFNDKTRTPASIFMESDNTDITNFYKEAHKGFSDDQISKIMGINILKKYIEITEDLCDTEKKEYIVMINQSIVVARNNLKMLANIYLEIVKDDQGVDVLRQGGPIDIYNGVKHGFKLVHPTSITKKIWSTLSIDTVDVMHRVLVDESTGQKIISLGGFQKITDELLAAIQHNIHHFSEEIHFICEAILWSQKEPMYIIKRFRLTKTREERKNQKISVNGDCPCGSNIKYKKCCQLFEYQMEHNLFGNLID